MALSILAGLAPALELNSPDGKVAVRFDLKTVAGSKACPVYSVRFQGRPVLADSRLGLELRGGPLASDFQITGEKTTTSDTAWQPVLGERDSVRDHFNQLVVDLR
jgi:hypothetical protein